MAVIHAVLRVWNTPTKVILRSGEERSVFVHGREMLFRTDDKKRNVFARVGRELHRSESAVRKTFNAAWKRQCPDEPKPSAERRRATMRMFLRMAGEELPRSWREEP